MSYNQEFKRLANSRYNTAGQFVSAGQLGQQSPQTAPPQRNTGATAAACNANISNLYPAANPPAAAPTPAPTPAPAPAPAQPVPQPQLLQQPPEPPLPQNVKMEAGDINMEGNGTEGKNKPAWMKNGVKKSNKERRRRQNEHLRRVLTPKNALMVLNEMISTDPHKTQAPNMAVGPVEPSQLFQANIGNKFCASISLEGSTYKGFGENKISARNAAAEQAIRDLVIKRMSKETSAPEPMEQSNGEGGEGASSQEEPLPMMQLASYALHKLFSEWQAEGFQVPLLTKPPSGAPAVGPASADEPIIPRPRPQRAPAKPKELPADAASLHPCMLLTNMRPGLVYHELGVEGDKPQNIIFTMGVTVDGTTYIGKASNKKEARKQAARSACQDIFKIQYTDS